jgi:thiamine biosynthesis lipoprotein
MQPLLICFGFLASLLPAQAIGRFHYERPLMGTLFSITCYADQETAAHQAAEEAFAKAAEINAVASDYLPDSELSRLNGTTEEKQLSPLLADLIRISLETAAKTDGLFDPTIGPLTKLWRITRQTGKLPDPEVLKATRDACGWHDLDFSFEEKTLRFHKPGMSLDLGGMAKGYTADRMLEAMARHGISRACIAAGGDLRLGEAPPDKAGWRVGLKGFDDDHNEEVMELANCAVSTSGDLHQHVEIEGKRYSHIIDPATGLGMTEHVAVTVIAATGTLSDALDTPMCLAGADRAEELGLKLGARRVIVRH